jgi:hypothetical protein
LGDQVFGEFEVVEIHLVSWIIGRWLRRVLHAGWLSLVMRG